MPRQLYLPGMGPLADGGEASPVPDDDASICMDPAGATACAQPRCPNCGGLRSTRTATVPNVGSRGSWR